MSRAVTIPTGNHQGKSFSDPSVPLKEVQYWAEKGRIANVKAAAVAELAARTGGQQAGGDPKASNAQAIQRPAQQGEIVVEGAFSDPAKASASLRYANEHFHFIGPATMVGQLPPGCAISMSLVHVDPNDPGLYHVGGNKYGLPKEVLDVLGAAAGVSFFESRRIDDRSHPHVCAWSVWGKHKLFDGTERTLPGNVEIDLREPDGNDYVAILEEARSKGREDPMGQIRQMRKFITRHAESKAMNRVIRRLGLRASYTKKELETPFAIARLMFTGHSQDPYERDKFGTMIAQSFLGGAAQLGFPSQQAPQVPQFAPPPPPYSQPFQPAHQGHAGQTGAYGGYHDVDSEPAPDSRPTQEQAQPEQKAEPQQEQKPAEGKGEPKQQSLIGDGYDDRGEGPDKF